MTDFDSAPIEVELHARLKRELVPPATPTRLYAHVEQLAVATLTAEAPPRRPIPSTSFVQCTPARCWRWAALPRIQGRWQLRRGGPT